MYNKLRPIIPGKNETVIYKPCIKFWKWTPLLPAATLNVYVDASALRIKSTDKKYIFFSIFWVFPDQIMLFEQYKQFWMLAIFLLRLAFFLFFLVFMIDNLVHNKIHKQI